MLEGKGGLASRRPDQSGFGLPAPSLCGAGRIRPSWHLKTCPGQGLLPPGSGQRQLLLAVYFSLGLLSLSHTITGNIQFNNDAVMHQPVDSCRGGHRVFKNDLPLGKGQIAGDHDAAPFVAFGQQGKEHLHLFPGLLHITDVVQDESFIAWPIFSRCAPASVPVWPAGVPGPTDCSG